MTQWFVFHNPMLEYAINLVANWLFGRDAITIADPKLKDILFDEVNLLVQIALDIECVEELNIEYAVSCPYWADFENMVLELSRHPAWVSVTDRCWINKVFVPDIYGQLMIQATTMDDTHGPTHC